MRLLVFLSVLLLAFNAAALDCGKVPDCAELGYSQTDNPDCAADGYMYCPFDTSYKKCVNYNCAGLGFTLGDKSEWCGKIIKCPQDENYTLCKLPASCSAADADTLIKLAGSGDCEVVYMLNDITLPLNQALNIAAGTSIEGSDYTLSLSGNKANARPIVFAGDGGFLNLTLDYQHTSNQLGTYLISGKKGNNIKIDSFSLKVNSTAANTWNIFANSTYHITNNFTADLHANRPTLLCADSSFELDHANIDIKSRIYDNAESHSIFCNGRIQNSQGNIDTDKNIFALSTTSIKNSKLTFKSVSVMYGSANILELQEGADVTIDSSNMCAANTFGQKILLSGASSNPAKLMLNCKTQQQISVVTSNTTDTLVFNGVTYKPTQPATTLLSAIASSPNWAKQ